MFQEYEQIVLTAAVIGDEGEEMKPGDVGVITYLHPNDEAFVVEFVSLDGETAVIATVRSSQARAVTSADFAHARTMPERQGASQLIDHQARPGNPPEPGQHD